MTSTLPGRVDNLTASEEAKLRELWNCIFKIYDIAESKPSTPVVEEAPVVPASPVSPTKERKGSLFRWRSGSSTTAPAPLTPSTSIQSVTGGNSEERFHRELLSKYLVGESPESIRRIIGSMSRHDNPDSLILRFLRARKWVIEDTLNMMFTVLNWRLNEIKIDDVMYKGELGAAIAEKGDNEEEKKISKGFLDQSRMGKSFWHGVDKQNRPICYIRVKDHNPKAQPPESMERYIVNLIETARLFLHHPVDTVCVVFNMDGFGLSNMDYHAVKFVIECFQTNYPECLGVLLIHNAPWIFQGIWKIIRGWLDPVVAAKVHFTNYRAGLEEYIAPDHLVKELSGDEDWTYNFIEPIEGENDIMKDTATRDRLQTSQQELYKSFEQLTRQWVAATDDAERAKINTERVEFAEKMRVGYWALDPYIRARSQHDRTGDILTDGSGIDWYKTGKNDANIEKLGALTLNGDAKDVSLDVMPPPPAIAA